MSKETLSHLFTPFFTTKEVGKAPDSGLSICYGIITAHNGVIYASSRQAKEPHLLLNYCKSLKLEEDISHEEHTGS